MQLLLLSRRGRPPPKGAEGARCFAADLAGDDVALCAALAAALAGVAAVTGVFHLAGVLDDGLIENMDEARLGGVVAPKVRARVRDRAWVRVGFGFGLAALTLTLTLTLTLNLTLTLTLAQAGLLPLLAHLEKAGLPPAWVMAASSTSSLLGFGGQANYCAANALLDSAATFGLPSAGLVDGGSAGSGDGCGGGRRCAPRLLTLNFGPWGEVGMAREGTKAHQLSLESGELPMASTAAVSCIAEALRQLQQLPTPGATATAAAAATATAITASDNSSSKSGSEPTAHGDDDGGDDSDAPPSELHPNALQFAVADVEWWRSPWPTHPLLQSFMRRLPALAEAETLQAAAAVGTAAAQPGGSSAGAESGGAEAGGGGGCGGECGDGGGGGSAAARERVETFLKGRLSSWELQAPLVELGLDSLDLVNLRTAFQKGFKCVVPLSTFTNANQTLEHLAAKLCERLLA